MGTAAYCNYAIQSKASQDLVFEKGAVKKSRSFVVYYLCQPEMNKLKISVCNYKKFGKAVNRNKVKRITKELLDDLVNILRPCMISVLPRPAVLKMDHIKRRTELVELFQECSLISGKVSL